MKYKILGIFVLTVLLIQIIPYGREHTNAHIVVEPKWDTAETRALFFRACADCHSNETKWPWYSNVAPVSWLVQHDVDEGREKFNISVWGIQKENEGDEAVKEVKEGEMPPWFYVIAHPEAKFSDSENALLLKGLLATFGQKTEKKEEE